MTDIIATAPTFTRPNDTTQYGSGDLVANNTAAASVVALNWQWLRDDLPNKKLAIRTAVIRCSGTGVTTKAFRVHLFTAIPTFVTGGDNSAISTVVATGSASWIGALDVAAMFAVADGSFGAGGPVSGMGLEVIWDNHTAPDAGGMMNLWGFLEARGAYTPAAQETFTVSLAGYPVADQ